MILVQQELNEINVANEIMRDGWKSIEQMWPPNCVG